MNVENYLFIYYFLVMVFWVKSVDVIFKKKIIQLFIFKLFWEKFKDIII